MHGTARLALGVAHGPVAGRDGSSHADVHDLTLHAATADRARARLDRWAGLRPAVGEGGKAAAAACGRRSRASRSTGEFVCESLTDTRPVLAISVAGKCPLRSPLDLLVPKRLDGVRVAFDGRVEARQQFGDDVSPIMAGQRKRLSQDCLGFGGHDAKVTDRAIDRSEATMNRLLRNQI